MGINRYSYSFNDPVNLSDPNGNYITRPEKTSVKIKKDRSLGRRKHDSDSRGVRVAQNGGSSGNSRVGTLNSASQQFLNTRANIYVRQIDQIRRDRGLPPAARLSNYPEERASPEILRALKAELQALQYSNAAGSPNAQAAGPNGGTYTLRTPGGEIVRNGRTNNHVRRSNEHARGEATKGYQYRVETRTDSYAAQRGLEQMQIQSQRGGLDKVNGISPTNPRRGYYMRAAEEYLESLGP